MKNLSQVCHKAAQRVNKHDFKIAESYHTGNHFFPLLCRYMAYLLLVDSHRSVCTVAAPPCQVTCVALPKMSQIQQFVIQSGDDVPAAWADWAHSDGRGRLLSF